MKLQLTALLLGAWLLGCGATPTPTPTTTPVEPDPVVVNTSVEGTTPGLPETVAAKPPDQPAVSATPPSPEPETKAPADEAKKDATEEETAEPEKPALPVTGPYAERIKQLHPLFMPLFVEGFSWSFTVDTLTGGCDTSDEDTGCTEEVRKGLAVLCQVSEVESVAGDKALLTYLTCDDPVKELQFLANESGLWLEPQANKPQELLDRKPDIAGPPLAYEIEREDGDERTEEITVAASTKPTFHGKPEASERWCYELSGSNEAWGKFWGSEYCFVENIGLVRYFYSVDDGGAYTDAETAVLVSISSP